MKLAFSAAIFAIVAGIVSAQTALALPAGVQKITSVEAITEYRLENGLKALLFPQSLQASDYREHHLSCGIAP
jgi:zinc protease